MQWVIGIDIGGTNCVVGAVAADGSRVVADHSQPTRPKRGADAVIADLAAMTATTIAGAQAQDADAEVLGVGVGAPGPLSIRRGVVLLTPNLGWSNVALRSRLGALVGLPVALENDANCAIQAETWIGAARGARCVIGLTLGTGIGGGIVLDGTVHHGASDAAGEFGHMVINFDGPLCGCGNRGCLEAYASGTNIARRARDLMAEGSATTLRALSGGTPEGVTAERVYAAARSGDALAARVAADTAQYLGIGIANLVNIFNPDIVVVVGGVSRAGDLLFEPLRREVASRAFASASDACRIVPGQLGDLAGVYGAARAFLDQRAAGVI